MWIHTAAYLQSGFTSRNISVKAVCSVCCYFGWFKLHLFPGAHAGTGPPRLAKEDCALLHPKQDEGNQYDSQSYACTPKSIACLFIHENLGMCDTLDACELTVYCTISLPKCCRVL